MATTCACPRCQACCRAIPGALISVADLNRLEAATREPDETEAAWARRLFVASAGAVLGNRVTGDRLEVPTLALHSTAAGACVHYRDGRCGIYAARPSGCSDFDCQQTDREAQTIGLPMHLERASAFADGSRYARLWMELHAAGARRSRENLNRRRRALG